MRILKEAPGPTEEQANHVSDFANQLEALQQAMYEDYEESALAAKEEKKKKKKHRRSRDPTVHSRGRSQSRGRTKNKCKHCKKYREFAAQHDAERCFYNKKYKGWRPSKVCKELGIRFKHRSKFASDMGGYPSESESESGNSASESESSAASSSSDE